MLRKRPKITKFLPPFWSEDRGVVFCFMKTGESSWTHMRMIRTQERKHKWTHIEVSTLVHSKGSGNMWLIFLEQEVEISPTRMTHPGNQKVKSLVVIYVLFWSGPQRGSVRQPADLGLKGSMDWGSVFSGEPSTSNERNINKSVFWSSLIIGRHGSIPH